MHVLWAPLFFAAWTLLLVGLIAGYRAQLVLQNRIRSNAFPSGTPHGPPWYQRLNRAHANCVENLPVFATIVVIGVLLDVDQALFLALPWIIVAARVGQTFAHLASGTELAVNIRFGFFVIQILAEGWLIALVILAQTG